MTTKTLRAEEIPQAELNLESQMSEITEVLEETGSLPPYIYSLIFGGIAIAFFFLRAPITRALIHFLFPKLRHSAEPEAVALKERIARLITYLFVATFAGLAIGTLPFFDRTHMLYLIGEKVLYTFYTAGLLYYLYHVVRAAVDFKIKNTETNEGRLRKNLISYLGSMSLGLFWIVAVILILSIWIQNLSTLIAGLGIGGLAIALAAQDTLANLFGSLSIMIDHPFEIGNWIETADLSGTVEHIGLRSTKVRSIDDALIFVPNRTLANAIVTNADRRRTRRVIQTFNFALDSDLEALQAWADVVTSQLDSWEGVIPGSSLAYHEGQLKHAHAMSLRFLTATPYDQMLATKENVTFNALRLAQEHGLELARPFFPDAGE